MLVGSLRRQAWQVALLALGARLVVGCADGCAGIECSDGASVAVTFTAPQGTKTFSIRVCKNDLCTAANVDVATIQTDLALGMNGHGYYSAPGDFTATLAIYRTSGTTFRLTESVQDAGPWKDGDGYVVTITGDTGWRATASGSMAYATDNSGEFCGEDCKRGELDLPPAYQEP